MNIALCIASRGHPIDLLRVIKETDERVKDPSSVTISVALDDDDESNPEKPETKSNLVWSIGPREDSLGAKYNRAATNAPADYYALGADDNVFKTQDWDEKIREGVSLLPDNFGFIYFGRLDGTLPTQMAIPHALIERQGFLFPPYFPFWFHDTWTDEIAHMTGKVLWVGIEVEEIGGRGKTRGLQDLSMWTSLFEMMRPWRIDAANHLSECFNEKWLQVQIEQRREILMAFFRSRMYRLIDPATSVQFEQRMSFDAKPTERYLRIKAQAERMIAGIETAMQQAAE